MTESFLYKKLAQRKEEGTYRELKIIEGNIDFCSNDYLGIVTANLLQNELVNDHTKLAHGSTGARLLTGNNRLTEATEKAIAAFHDAEAALIFNSGYDANSGLLQSVAQKGDSIIYDKLSHASIRDGIRLSFANSQSFAHNDTLDLEQKLAQATGNIFVVTESVFSMDGDFAPLNEINRLCEKFKANLIVDEAHATGVIGERGEGLVQSLGLQKKCFARVYTFGKALGCHGAAVVGSAMLKNYLVNFSRSFIYTTALPPFSVAAINTAYHLFPGMTRERIQLQMLVKTFRESSFPFKKLDSNTPVQAILVPGNKEARLLAAFLQENGMDIRPILYPTVPLGKERLRIVLHSFNTNEEIGKMISLLQHKTGSYGEPA